jgi:hypothetical protein
MALLLAPASGATKRYIGTSMDAKPIDAPIGASFEELDTERFFTFDGQQWYPRSNPQTSLLIEIVGLLQSQLAISEAIAEFLTATD